MGTYKDTITHSLKTLEGLLGLYVLSNNTKISDLPINDFLDTYVKSEAFKKLPKSKQFNGDAMFLLTTLSMLDRRCSFGRVSVLDFRSYTGVDILFDLIYPFQKKENLSNELLKNLDGLKSYLELLETSSLKYINTLSYRYIRVFICLLLVKNYFNASVVGNFIINQIYIGDGIDNSIKIKLEDMKRSNETVIRAADNARNATDIKDRNGLSHAVGSANRAVKKTKKTISEIKNKVFSEDEEEKLTTNKPKPKNKQKEKEETEVETIMDTKQDGQETVKVEKPVEEDDNSNTRKSSMFGGS